MLAERRDSSSRVSSPEEGEAMQKSEDNERIELPERRRRGQR
jgi:hypothetical protein